MILLSLEVTGTMSDLTSSIDEDDNFLDHQYKNGKQQQFNDFSPNPFISLPVPKSDSKIRRKSSVKHTVDADDVLNFLPGSDPLRVELTRLENEVRGI